MVYVDTLRPDSDVATTEARQRSSINPWHMGHSLETAPYSTATRVLHVGHVMAGVHAMASSTAAPAVQPCGQGEHGEVSEREGRQLAARQVQPVHRDGAEAD